MISFIILVAIQTKCKSMPTIIIAKTILLQIIYNLHLQPFFQTEQNISDKWRIINKTGEG